MDRRYYGLKALIVVLGMGLAVLSGTLGAPRIGNTMANIHYGAAASAEMTLIRSTADVARSVRDFVRHCQGVAAQPR